MSSTRSQTTPKLFAMITGIAIIALVGCTPVFATSGAQTQDNGFDKIILQTQKQNNGFDKIVLDIHKHDGFATRTQTRDNGFDKLVPDMHKQDNGFDKIILQTQKQDWFDKIVLDIHKQGVFNIVPVIHQQAPVNNVVYQTESSPVISTPIASPPALEQTSKIPFWVKNIAGFWSQGTIDNSSYFKAMQYLISQGIIPLPHTDKSDFISQQIPSWTKNDAVRWAAGQMSDDDFIKALQNGFNNMVPEAKHDGFNNTTLTHTPHDWLNQQVPQTQSHDNRFDKIAFQTQKQNNGFDKIAFQTQSHDNGFDKIVSDIHKHDVFDKLLSGL